MALSTYGRLDLAFVCDCLDSNATRMVVREQTPPLRVVRAFPQDDGAAMVHLHNVSGGVLAGDELDVMVRLDAGARARLTTTGATRVYRRRPAGASMLRTHAVVAPGALLEYLPDPIIPFRHANVRQRTKIDLQEDAGVLWWEIVAPGRAAMGESFAYDLLEMEMHIDVGEMPIVRDRMCWNPHERAAHSPSRMGAFDYFASFYACRAGIDVEALESALTEDAQRMTRSGEVLWGASALHAHGAVVRGVARTSRALQSGLLEFWNTARRLFRCRMATMPRKIY